MALKVDRNFVSASGEPRGTVPKIVSRPPWQPPPLATPATVSESIYIPRATVPFHLRRSRQRRRRTRTSVCRPLTHSQYSNLNAPSSPACLSLGWLARTCVALWILLASFFLPASPLSAIAIAIRHRWFLYIRAELMVWPLFPFLFLLAVSPLSFPSLLRVYLWSKCANNNVNSHYHKERAASFGRAVSPYLERSCVTSMKVSFPLRRLHNNY